MSIHHTHFAWRIFGILLIFVLCVVLFIASLPFLLSTERGSAWLSKKVGDKLGVHIHIKQMHLSWFGVQSIEQFQFENKKEQLALSCEHITCDAMLMQILLTHDWGHVAVQAPSLYIAKPFSALKQRPALLQRAGLVPEIETLLSPPHLGTAHIVVKEGTLTLEAPGFLPLAFEDVGMVFDLGKDGSIQASVTCNTVEGSDRGHIAIEGAVQGKELKFHTDITHLPTRGLDQIVALSAPRLTGLIYNAIGSTLDLTANCTATPEHLELVCNLVAPKLRLSLDGASSEGKFALNKPLFLHSDLTTPLIKSLGKLLPSLNALTLSQPSWVELQLEAFSWPLPLDLKNLSQSTIQGNVQIAPQTTGLLSNKPLIIETLTATISSETLEKQLSMDANCQLSIQGHTGSLRLSGSVESPLSQAPRGGFLLNAEQFPLAFFDLSGAPLSSWLGSTVDINASLSYRDQDPQLSLSWTSPRLTLSAMNLSWGSNSSTLALLAPVSFQYQPPLEAVKTPLRGMLNSLILPLSDYTKIQLNADCTIDELALSDSESIRHLQTHFLVNTLSQITLGADSDLLNLSTKGSFNLAREEFTLLKPLVAHYTLTPQALPQLSMPTQIHLTIDPTTLFLANRFASTLKGSLFCEKALLKAHETLITVTHTSLPFEWNPQTQELQVSLTSLMEETQSSLKGAFTLSSGSKTENPSVSNAHITGSLNAQNLSSDLLGSLIGKHYLAGLIGPSFNATIHLTSTQELQNITVNCTSPLLNLESAFRIDSQGISTEGNKQVLDWTLTPSAYLILDKLILDAQIGAASFELTEPATMSCLLSKVFLPTGAPAGSRFPIVEFDLNQLEVVLEGRIPSLTFVETLSKEKIQLSSLSLKLDKRANKAPLDIGLQTQVNSQSSTAPRKSGSLNLTCTIDPYPETKTTGSLSIKAQNFPSRVLDLVARTAGRSDFPFTTLLGGTFQLGLDATLKDFTGPVTLTLNSPLTQIDIAGQCANGALLLNRPLHAQIQVTKETSRLLLKEVNPLDLSYIYSEAPVTLSIPSEGVYIPIHPTSTGKIAIPSARLELGKVSCRNEGNIGTTLSLLKSRQFDKQGELSLWFAPCDFSIKQGLLSLDRSEILIANTFDICIFGKVDLLKNYVDMKLGLTAQTLHKAFGINKLPEHYVLTIPMKGPADNVKIDSGAATAKVALLLAWQQKALAGLFNGGPVGALAGDLLGSVALLPDINAKVPPAKHPYPWETGEQKTPPPRGKKKAFKTTDKPLKQLMKVVK
jgi:hypothetical protein